MSFWALLGPIINSLDLHAKLKKKIKIKVGTHITKLFCNCYYLSSCRYTYMLPFWEHVKVTHSLQVILSNTCIPCPLFGKHIFQIFFSPAKLFVLCLFNVAFFSNKIVLFHMTGAESVTIWWKRFELNKPLFSRISFNFLRLI